MNKTAIAKRLSSYWKMEAANVVLVPGIFAFLAVTNDWTLGPATFVALAAVCALLVIGAFYWRAKLKQLESGSALPANISMLARLQIPMALLVVAAVAAAAVAWLVPAFAASLADRWCASIAALLAVLEYVNYYHRQLQHFDHLPDLKRLLTGRGFRRAQMAVDLARWRGRAR